MFTYRTYKQSRPIASSQISIDDLKRICHECIVVNATARSNEVNYQIDLFKVFDQDSEADKVKKKEGLAKEIALIDSHSLVVITIEGASGERFTIVPGEDLEKVFSHVNIPHKITKIRLDNWSNFQIFTEKLPYYRITIELDFSDSVIWSFQNPDPINQSHIEAFGLTEMWVLGAVEKLSKAVERRHLIVTNFIHRFLKYGLIVWIVGIPGVILALSRYGKVIFPSSSPGIEAISFLALSLFCLTIFRAFYNYIKWLFPYLELDEQPKRLQLLQRSIAVFIVLGIISGWLSVVSELIVPKKASTPATDSSSITKPVPET